MAENAFERLSVDGLLSRGRTNALGLDALRETMRTQPTGERERGDDAEEVATATDGGELATDPAEQPPIATDGGEPATDSVTESTTDVADRIVVSYPGDLSSWGRFQVEKPSFRAFLRKTRDRARTGDVWEEFVGVGCCGNTLDVPLQVEAVEGGDRLGPATEIEYTVRESCDVQGSWRVQSAGGPAHSSTATEGPEDA